MRYFNTFLVFILLTLFSCSQEKPIDTSTRGFDQDQMGKYNSLSLFDYDKSIPEPEPTSLMRFWNDLISALAWLFNSFLGYVILIVLVGLLIWLIIKQTTSSRISLKRDLSDTIIVHDDEDIDRADYLALIEKALSSSNYRLAVRFSFLHTLQSLQNLGRIKWHKEKTNSDYLDELESSSAAAFKDLVFIYEYVWYGEFQASRAIFDRVHSTSNALISPKE